MLQSGVVYPLFVFIIVIGKKMVNVISASNLLQQYKQDMASKKAARSNMQGLSSSQSSPSLNSSSPRQRTLLETTKHNSTPPPEDPTPKLGRGWSGGGDIDLDLDVGASPVRFGSSAGKGKTSIALAKQKALALVRRKGPIKKEDPNAVKKTLDDRKKEATKRRAEENWKKEELEEGKVNSLVHVLRTKSHYNVSSVVPSFNILMICVCNFWYSKITLLVLRIFL